MPATTWSGSGASATRTASRCGGSSRNIGSSGRPGADDTRKPMQSSRPSLKKLREPGKATEAGAGRGHGRRALWPDHLAAAALVSIGGPSCLELFLQHLRHELGEGPIGVVLDSSGSHRSGEVVWPQDMHPLYLPPYSPELNPAEQIFRHIRKHLSNTVFTTLDELQNALIDQLQQFWEHPTVLLHLTGYPWWVEAVNANISSSP